MERERREKRTVDVPDESHFARIDVWLGGEPFPEEYAGSTRIDGVAQWLELALDCTISSLFDHDGGPCLLARQYNLPLNLG
jgi:hypothetical protein